MNRYDRVGQMSGGERRRLQLLQVLARAPNVLLLDEPSEYPTNPIQLIEFICLSVFFKGFIILSAPFIPLFSV